MEPKISEMTINDFIEAYSHAQGCRCPKCLQWWVHCGPVDTLNGPSWGPFDASEIYNAGGLLPLHRGEDARPD
jgi:hypothetical protein